MQNNYVQSVKKKKKKKKRNLLILMQIIVEKCTNQHGLLSTFN